MSVTTLYRFYSDADDLLYVGISERGPERWKAHRREKPWWIDVTYTTTEHYDTRQQALDAERDAIIAEKPLYNVVHNGGASQRASQWTDEQSQQMLDTIVALKKASSARSAELTELWEWSNWLLGETLCAIGRTPWLDEILDEKPFPRSLMPYEMRK